MLTVHEFAYIYSAVPEHATAAGETGEAEGQESAECQTEGDEMKDRAMQWLIAGGIVFAGAVAVWASVAFMTAEGLWR